MKSELKFTRDIFLGKLSSEYDISIQHENMTHLRTLLAKVIIHSLLPIECIKERTIMDMKGRDALNLIDNKLPSNILPTEDEFFFIKGIWSLKKQVEEGVQDQDSDDNPLYDFSLRINSIFDEYVGREQIRYKCALTSEGDIPEELLGQPEVEDKEITCSALRVGIDIFSPHFFNILGLGPTVNQTLLIDSYENRLLIRITAENLKKKSILPLERENLLEKLDRCINEVFGFSIKNDYIQQINM